MEPLLAEIRLFPLSFVPQGWLACQGQLLPIQQNQALFALLGTTYGGNGQTVFALPDLRGRVPLHAGAGRTAGAQGGTESVQLTGGQLPAHTHAPRAAAAATATAPGGALWAATTQPHYGPSSQVALAADAVTAVGGGQPHANMPPYLTMTYAIATQGVFPSHDGGAGGEPFVGEIRMFAGTFAPGGWAFCNGQLMPLAQNTALFSLLGTSFGGNGSSTFALPDLQGASPVGVGQGAGLSSFEVGDRAGAESVTLTADQLPAHTHTAQATGSAGTAGNPSGARWAVSRRGRATERLYGTTPATTMSGTAVAPAGDGGAHPNMPPYTTLSFIIALQGTYPQRP
ncbi:phage tail protein [Cellulomonas oligotrophica]|uniref:Microcystin-dependent protein n=1 Tax=Cellulomonas oligotrophica TaxID=931536 RepID=A0A7Y9FHN9_9CELL|nr:tail fiber protein [Cellulomonas oligotrophica]NYD87373.1 microcystin-dependent protein [Cellulomonas oligotrophica]GIG34539.1 hypothetical protein Col01nite_36980 [Cellulomonas oligotrophica]